MGKKYKRPTWLEIRKVLIKEFGFNEIKGTKHILLEKKVGNKTRPLALERKNQILGKKALGIIIRELRQDFGIDKDEFLSKF
ncbi:MAG: hypothetical protein J7K26_04080 [Candidatus Aenigmarchaeota archaeon]|nr:hypothetical protein [Candidatus Aenigmarchaeota archaeon]